MQCKIIDGKAISEKINIKLKKLVHKLPCVPSIAILLVGNDNASVVYTRNKVKTASRIGISAELIHLPYETSQKELLGRIENLNSNNSVHGILIQLPLPSHIDKDTILNAIDPMKDIDGLSDTNQSRMKKSKKILYEIKNLKYSSLFLRKIKSINPEDFYFIPCTPLGCLHLINSTTKTIGSKNITIFGTSKLVGGSLACLLEKKSANITTVNKQTERSIQQTKDADIIVTATGCRNLLCCDIDACGGNKIIIDVGMNRNENGKLCGDCNFESFKNESNCQITPVPGGVGPMTITSLMLNSVIATIINSR